jgi:hypothetical protein
MSTTNSTTSPADCLRNRLPLPLADCLCDRPLLLLGDCLCDRPSLPLADCLRDRPSLPPADCLRDRHHSPTNLPADLSATIRVHDSEALTQKPNTHSGMGFCEKAEVVLEMDNDTVVLVAVFAAKYHHLRRQRAQLLLHQRQQHWVAPYEYIQKSFSLELMTPGRAATWLR